MKCKICDEIEGIITMDLIGMKPFKICDRCYDGLLDHFDYNPAMEE